MLFVKENHWLWHNKLGHACFRLISKLQKHNLVRELPSMSYKDNLLCEAFQKGKQIKNFFSSKNIVSSSTPLELLHLDMFGLTRTTSICGKKYGLIIVDDYSRWTWVIFLSQQEESFSVFFKFCKRVQNKKRVCITSIRSDHGREIKNDNFQLFYEENGILHNFSTPRTTQHNGLAEKRNRSL